MGPNDRDIAHAGTSKAMPVLAEQAASSSSKQMPVITSEQADSVTGEIDAEIPPEPTAKIARPAGADKIAAERGMPPLRKPTRRTTKPTRRTTKPTRRTTKPTRRAQVARRDTKLGVSPFRKR